MTIHYRLDIYDDARLSQHDSTTLCGVDILQLNVQEYRHIPADSECSKYVVDCPLCLGIYDAIGKDYVDRSEEGTE